MENRIKECQLDLFADRTSAATMRANQLRRWPISFFACCAASASDTRDLPERHDPSETAQDRRLGPRQRAPNQSRHGLRFSAPGRVPLCLRIHRHSPALRSKGGKMQKPLKPSRRKRPSSDAPNAPAQKASPEPLL